MSVVKFNNDDGFLFDDPATFLQGATFNGNLKLNIGTPIDGYYLKTDANGNATWSNVQTTSLSTEDVQDIMGSTLVNGSVLVSYNDTANTITLNVDNEYIEDRIFSHVTGSNGITVNYDDNAGTLDISNTITVTNTTLNGVFAYNASSSQSIPTNTLTKVLFNDELYDDSNYHGAGDLGMFTIPATGKYMIVCQVEYVTQQGGISNAIVTTNGSTNIIAKSYKRFDDSPSLTTTNDTSETQVHNMSTVRTLAAGTQVFCYVAHSANAANSLQTGDGRTFMSITRLDQTLLANFNLIDNFSHSVLVSGSHYFKVIGNQGATAVTSSGTAGSLADPHTLTITSNDISFIGTGTTTLGNLYYLNGGTWTAMDTNYTNSNLLGIALGTSPTTNGMLLRGYTNITGFGTWTVGQEVCLFDNTVTPTVPTGTSYTKVHLGHCTNQSGSVTTLRFDPDYTRYTIMN